MSGLKSKNEIIKENLTISIIAEFVLYDLNRTVNEELGREVFDFHKLVQDRQENVVISYKNVSSLSTKIDAGESRPLKSRKSDFVNNDFFANSFRRAQKSRSSFCSQSSKYIPIILLIIIFHF